MGIMTIGQKTTIKGGEIISRMLAAEGVTSVFGIIDGTYFGFYSTLAKHGMKLITPRHETCAAHMAGAYARLTGKLGVCMASNGPGVANILPGVAVENAEGNRVLLITSSRREGIIYPDRGGTYQYFPQVEVTAPMTKWSCAVDSVDRLAEVMRRALRLCFTGRPGVVHVDVPESIMNGAFEVDPTWFRGPATYRNLTPLAANGDLVAKAARLLIDAKAPVIHAGSGVGHAGASAELHELAELLQIPITTSWGARATVDERREQVISMTYVEAVNTARRDSDLVLALGSRIGETDWWGKAPYWGTPDEQALIQVDTDEEILGNIRPADLMIQADVKVFLQQVIAAVKGLGVTTDLKARKARLAELQKACRARRKKLDKHLSDMATPMNSAHVATICRQTFADDSIIVIDGGNTAIWANFYHEVRQPDTVLGTPKMGMLGAGVSQALGAKVAFPDRQVYCIIGDGAMGFHQQEIETAVRNKLAVVYLVLCDKQWGMVKMNQQFALKPVKTLLMKSLSPEETINTDLSETRFDELAKAMGAYGERVSDPTQLKGALDRALAAGKCAVLHLDVDPVKHMWAPDLRVFKAMHEEPKG
jgi:acetolactate synthase-1/2/3 large subunit